MRAPLHPQFKLGLLLVAIGGVVAAALFFPDSPPPVRAQNSQEPPKPPITTVAKAETTNAVPKEVTNSPPAVTTTAAAPTAPNAAPAPAALAAAVTAAEPPPSGAPPTGAQPPEKGAASTNAPPGAGPPVAAEAEKESASGEISLSLQGANVDTVVQWLAKTTGKSVVKHPKVQCQLTIVSSKRLPAREAVNLVYRALALEGFSTIETSKSIVIAPEGQEPKTSPELVDLPGGALPEGRQRLIKIFHLEHVSPGEVKEKVRGVMTEKGTAETDDHGNNLIVTDYTDNVRLIGELIKGLDADSASDTVIEIYPIKYGEADELATLLGLILNAQAAPAGQPMPGQPMPGMPMPGQPMPGMPPGQPMPGQPGRPPGAPGGGGGAGQQVRFWPDKTSNRLIVSAPKSKLPEVKKLLEILDTEKPQDVAVRVITLKNVTAEDLVKEIGPLYQKVSGKSVKDMIEVAASSRANSLIVLSSEANFKGIEKLIATLDTEDALEKVMQAFVLKNADAEDVAKQLKDLSQDQDNNRFPYYIFSSSGSGGKSSKKLSVVADRRRNTVIVQAPPNSMDGIAKMIQTLDEPVSDNALAPKIFRLKYVSAVDIEDVLNELFLKKQQQRNYFFYYDDYPQETADKNVGRLYGKVRITSEPYSNSIIVTSNSKESLEAVEDVIKQLDSPSEAGESTLRVGLKFAKAAVVANSINILFAKNGSPALRQQPQPGQPNPAPQQPQPQGTSSQSGFELEKENKEEGYFPWLGGNADNPRGTDGRTTARPVSDLVGRVRAVPDQRSNALLISANVHFFPQVLKLVTDLDAPTEQVLIEARLVEISNDYLDKLGVRWSPNGSQVFTADDYDNSLLAHASGGYQKGFGGNTVANTPAATSTGASLAQTLTSLRSGVLDASINMDYLVQFLRKNTDAKVLAEPQINIRDNETGRLFVGQQVPIPQNTVVSQLGGQNTSFTYKDVGVVLEVTPHINTAGDVELSIHAESSTVVPGEIVLGGSVFDTRNFRTDLTAKNGQTLVLGGIIQKQLSETLRKTPVLGDIPGLGWAFKKKDKTTRDVELMVFMRPKVTRSPEQAQQLLEEIYQKAPGMRQWNEDNLPNVNKDKSKQPEPKK